MPPLKGEVAFHHVSDEMTEGSEVKEPSCRFLMYRHKRLNYKQETGIEEYSLILHYKRGEFYENFDKGQICFKNAD